MPLPSACRPDIRLWKDGDPMPSAPLYVMYVTREAFYRPSIRLLDLVDQPVYEIRIDDAPILKIHRFEAGQKTESALGHWAAEGRWFAAKSRIDGGR